MDRAALARAVRNVLFIPGQHARSIRSTMQFMIVREIFNIIARELQKGNSVSIQGFGRFYVIYNKSRTWVKFRPADRFIREVNESHAV